ncbi:T-cell differentiation antigen CD6 isoform X2 [Denticeps clupeoides]|uniref:SRCR domain-containing protein n=1 Tax=Denticeps clupeoides TaxID=299321 RepID=A0AAY4B756_9TELE|nr:T-cell differentiation antigen CD6-like isoform X2 [Denticeps clupeoides]
MDLIRWVAFLQVLCSCQAIRNTTSPHLMDSLESDTSNASRFSHFSLSKICDGQLEVHHEGTKMVAALSPENQKEVAEHVCEHLQCGKLHKLTNKNNEELNNCLTNCTYRDTNLHNCTEAAGSICRNLTEIQCGHQVVRLSGSKDECEGRVELWGEEGWGTVCDDGWDLQDGHVVCAQLGCGFALQVTGEKGQFGPGSGHIYMLDVSCIGNEQNLWQCRSQRNMTIDCGHKEDSGVVCSGNKSSPTTPAETTQTSWSTESTVIVVAADSHPHDLHAAEAGCVVLSIALLAVLAYNAVLCKRYRKKTAGEMQQSVSNTAEDAQQNEQEQGLLQVPSEGPPHPDASDDASFHRPVHPEGSLTSSCNSNDQNYIIATEEEEVDKSSIPPENTATVSCQERAPENAALHRQVSTDSSTSSCDSSYAWPVVIRQTLSVEPSDSSSEDDYVNVGPKADSQIDPDDVGADESLQPFPHDEPVNVPRTSTADSLGSFSSSSEDDYENIGPDVETLLKSELTSTSTWNSEKTSPTPDPPGYQDQLSHYNTNHLSPINQDNASSTSEELYENVPETEDEGTNPTLTEDLDTSSSGSDYDEVPE